MKERPILFSAPMVRAILDRRKTQTRRVVKPQPFYCDLMPNPVFPKNEHERAEQSGLIWPNSKEEILDRSPYGKIGYRLWVRETFGMKVRTVGGTPHEKLCYRADNANEVYAYSACGNEIPVKWKPSIHMPRGASRITLEITDIRIERLNEISEGDALAEGIERLPTNQYKDYGCKFEGVGFSDPRLSFKSLWQSIHGYDSWIRNPWTWVIEFKRVA